MSSMTRTIQRGILRRNGDFKRGANMYSKNAMARFISSMALKAKRVLKSSKKGA